MGVREAELGILVRVDFRGGARALSKSKAARSTRSEKVQITETNDRGPSLPPSPVGRRSYPEVQRNGEPSFEGRAIVPINDSLQETLIEAKKLSLSN